MCRRSYTGPAALNMEIEQEVRRPGGHDSRSPERFFALAVSSGSVTFGQFAASLGLGVLSVLIPLVVFVAIVAGLVYVARWWIDRGRPRT